jgi:uncharacterized membrane protein
VEKTAERIVETIAQQTSLDRAANLPHRVLGGLLHKAPALAHVLHGDWLGHPLHAAMVTVPVGAFTAGFALDMADIAGAGRKFRRGADAVTAIGLAGALGAAVAGMADWSTTRDDAKRLGFVHGVTNLVVAGLYGTSLLSRATGMRRLGIALSSTGFGLLLLSSWLGGELAYRFGVGVRPEAFESQGSSPRSEASRPLTPEHRQA